MARDTILFDINETVLDLASLQPRFEAVFGDGSITARWFAMLRSWQPSVHAVHGEPAPLPCSRLAGADLCLHVALLRRDHSAHG